MRCCPLTPRSLSDTRTLGEVVNGLIREDYIPSWCTACYRVGRTGEAFMQFSKAGLIHNYCHPNAMLTLAEYLIDYADEDTAKLGWDMIDREGTTIDSDARRRAFFRRLEKIKQGRRDLFF
jgi:2-iminoacetate synthase